MYNYWKSTVGQCQSNGFPVVLLPGLARDSSTRVRAAERTRTGPEAWQPRSRIVWRSKGGLEQDPR